MAAFNFFNCFAEDEAKKLHNLHTDTLKVALTNSAPVATNTVLADITQISATNGYTSGGFDTQNAVSRVGAVTSITGVDITVTASGGSMAAYRYVVLYNDTASGDPLIGWWDKGGSVTLADTESDLIDFGSSLFDKSYA
jgi:hypothetical protein